MGAMTTELPAVLRGWLAAGQFADIDDTRIWYRVEGSGPWLVCFHGFPTSSWDWHRLLPLIRDDFRVLLFDFPGYGLSAKPPRRDYSVLRQLDAAELLLRSLDIGAFHLLAHDMGDTVACELLHRLEQGQTGLEPLSVTLLNGGIYPDLHRPLPTQRLLRTRILGELTARLATWRVFMHQYPRVYAQPGSFDAVHYRAQWALMLHRRGRRTLAKVAVYMRERFRHERRWLDPLHRTGLPLSLIWGREDPIAVLAMARRLQARQPATRVEVLDGIGHYPQLEAPDRLAAILRGVLAAPRPDPGMPGAQ